MKKQENMKETQVLQEKKKKNPKKEKFIKCLKNNSK